MTIRFAVKGLAAAFAALTLAAGPVEAQDLRLGVITPPTHVWTKVAERIAERLPEATGGTLSTAVFPGGQLGSEPEMYQQLSSGLLDMGLLTVGVSTLRAPSMNGWMTPYLFDSVEEAAKVTDSEPAKAMLEDLTPTGVVGLGYTFAGMRQILMREGTIESPEDLTGKKIRIVPFPAMKTWWEAVGTVPTPINLTEMYQALQSGLLDGIDIDLDALVGLKFQEVGKSLTLTNHMAFPAVFVVSSAAWDRLDETQRKQVGDVVAEALAWGTEQQIAAEKSNLAALEGSLEISRLDDGATLFADANKKTEESFGDDATISAFQELARSEAK